MRVWKPTYRDRSGQKRELKKWWTELRDHLGTVRRFPAFSDKALSEALGRQIECLVACRIAGQQPGLELSRWLEQIPDKLRIRLGKIALLDRTRAGGKPLADHLTDFEQSLFGKGGTARYARQTTKRVRRLFDLCRFRAWTDISASRLQTALADLRQGHSGISAQTLSRISGLFKQWKFTTWTDILANRLQTVLADLRQGDSGIDAQILSRIKRLFKRCKFTTWTDISASRLQIALADLRQPDNGISAQTSNFYLKAAKQFCHWMVQDRRTSESPLQHLTGLNVRTDRRHDRRALEPEQVRRLLEAARAAGERFGMSGYERAMLYRLAVETGLRRSELRSLTVNSFDLDKCTVTVEAAYSKHRRQDVLSLRPDTVVELREFLRGKLPGVRVFNVGDKTCKMIKADLEAANICYVDESGRYADFHSLRHTTGSWLAASGVHPSVAQRIMRHSDINLTMSRYTHLFRGQESEAVARLPDLSLPSEQQKAAAVRSGTDGCNLDTPGPQEKNLASHLAFQDAQPCNSVHEPSQVIPTGAIKNAVSTAPGGARTPDLRFRRPTLCPIELQAQPSLSSDQLPTAKQIRPVIFQGGLNPIPNPRAYQAQTAKED